MPDYLYDKNRRPEHTPDKPSTNESEQDRLDMTVEGPKYKCKKLLYTWHKEQFCDECRPAPTDAEASNTHPKEEPIGAVYEPGKPLRQIYSHAPKSDTHPSVEQQIRHEILVPLVHEVLMKRQREKGSLTMGDESKLYGKAIAAINDLRQADQLALLDRLEAKQGMCYDCCHEIGIDEHEPFIPKRAIEAERTRLTKEGASNE